MCSNYTETGFRGEKPQLSKGRRPMQHVIVTFLSRERNVGQGQAPVKTASLN